MSSVDEEPQEPFKLCVDAIQGKWLCEELGVSLRVNGNTVQYVSGECYPLEVTPEGKLEIFGYRGIEKKSDASSVTWKHKETGQYLTWMYEGDNEDHEPEVDSNLIIQSSSGGRTTRKRKVDYVALDKELDTADTSLSSTKQASWKASHSGMNTQESTSSSGPSEADIAESFMELKGQFEKWLRGTNTDRFKEIVAKRGYLSTELKTDRTSRGAVASSRFSNYLKSLGAKAWDNQDGGGINIRVPETLWRQYTSIENQDDSLKGDDNHEKRTSVLSRVQEIKNSIIKFVDVAEVSDEAAKSIDVLLEELESLPVTLEILKETRIGVEINRISKIYDRAKKTLDKLKAVYLDSKKD